MNFVIHQGDVFEKLRELEAESVNCCVTSPPYFGLRDYSTGKWEGGSADCDHKQVHGSQGKTGQRADRAHPGDTPYKNKCGKCSAVRVDKQLGLEKLHDCAGWATGVKCGECFICKMVQVFEGVKRVLRKDGTLWINMGDSHNASPGQRKDTDKAGPKQRSNQASTGVGSRNISGLKPKDLLGMPWRLAFALQVAGWYLRMDIIWKKTTPMPESVKDRPTREHEYIFLLSKSKRYYYDHMAIAEPASPDSHARYARGRSQSHKYADGGPGNQTIAKGFEHMRDRTPAGWHQGTRPATPQGIIDKQAGHGKRHAGFNDRWAQRTAGVNPKAESSSPGSRQNASFSAAVKDLVDFRNKRSVWTISAMPTADAHFATFPLELPEICLLAGCPEGGLVLDPFAGSGTTGLAALKNNRRFVGVELNPDYIQIAMNRVREKMPLLVG